jgi:hypothetical protein
MGTHMRTYFRKTLPETEDVTRRMGKAANNAATHLEGWAKDGYDSVKGRPAMWGAASLGIGALAGGLYALWRNKGRLNGMGLEGLWPRNGKANGRTMAARSRTKPRRVKAKMDGAGDMQASHKHPAKRGKRTRRARPAEQQAEA